MHPQSPHGRHLTTFAPCPKRQQTDNHYHHDTLYKRRHFRRHHDALSPPSLSLSNLVAPLPWASVPIPSSEHAHVAARTPSGYEHSDSILNLCVSPSRKKISQHAILGWSGSSYPDPTKCGWLSQATIHQPNQENAKCNPSACPVKCEP